MRDADAWARDRGRIRRSARGSAGSTLPKQWPRRAVRGVVALLASQSILDLTMSVSAIWNQLSARGVLLGGRLLLLLVAAWDRFCRSHSARRRSRDVCLGYLRNMGSIH